MEAELQQWGDRSAEYYKRKTEEFKEIMMIMARTAEAVGDRDQRYSKQFTEFTTRLHSLASMDDLTMIRDSLVSSANELQAGVNQMAQDGEEAVARMRGELRQYQAKLEEAERSGIAGQPDRVAEPAEDGSGVGTAGGAAHAVFGAGSRFERFQAGQRHLRPRGGRRCADAIRHGIAGGLPRDGRRGPVGWR